MSAQAFLLVYSATDPESLNYVKRRFEEIREERSDFQVGRFSLQEVCIVTKVSLTGDCYYLVFGRGLKVIACISG